MKIKVITNMPRMTNLQCGKGEFEFIPYVSYGLRPAFSMFIKAFHCDYMLFNSAFNSAMIFALMKWFIPFNRAKIVILDILLPTPRGVKGRARALIVSWLMKKVHMVLLYYKDTRGLQEHYGIPKDKFAYVPFKINRLDIIEKTVPMDGGYVFCGGKTRRDFATLFEAVKELECPVLVVTTDNDDIAQHGSHVDERSAPANVRVIRLDGNPEKFISLMASARVVVLPIKPDICGAGIGVYIMAMALRKCVVISSGPGADDILPPAAALVVPARDPVSLRLAIQRTFNDPAYRSVFEEGGYQYAKDLRGEERLVESIASRLREDWAGR